MLLTEPRLENRELCDDGPAQVFDAARRPAFDLKGGDPVASPCLEVQIESTDNKARDNSRRELDDFLARALELMSLPPDRYVIAHARDSGLDDVQAHEFLSDLQMSSGSGWYLVGDAHADSRKNIDFLTPQLRLDAIIDQHLIRWVRRCAPHMESTVFRTSCSDDSVERYITYLDTGNVAADDLMSRL